MSKVKDSSDREIVSARVLNAPRERVFKAWTDPAQLGLIRPARTRAMSLPAILETITVAYDPARITLFGERDDPARAGVTSR